MKRRLTATRVAMIVICAAGSVWWFGLLVLMAGAMLGWGPWPDLNRFAQFFLSMMAFGKMISELRAACR